MNKFINMMNQMNQMYLFSGCAEKICFAWQKWQKKPLSKANLIKTCGNGVHLVHRFIIIKKKLINILNINQLIDKYDEPMNPYVLTGAYAFFMPCLNKRHFLIRKTSSKRGLFNGQTTSRYIGSSQRFIFGEKHE